MAFVGATTATCSLDVPHRRTAADDLSKRSRFLLSEIGVLSLEFPSNVELLLELSLGLFHLLDRSAGCSEHEVHDHFQLLDGLILALDAYKVIEITADRQAQLVRDLLHHSAEILTRPDHVPGHSLFHAPLLLHRILNSHSASPRFMHLGSSMVALILIVLENDA